MIIKEIEIIYIKLPMKIVFETSFGKIAYRPAIIIKITDSLGNIGYGEASTLDVPISENETSFIGLEILRKEIIPKIIGQNIKSISCLNLILEKLFKKYPITTTGVESAYFNLISIRKNKSIENIFKGGRRSIPIGHSIGIQKTKKELFDNIQEALNKGFKKVKIKIKPGYDLDVVKSIRKKFPELNFAIDANAAYSKKDIPLFVEMDKVGLYMIEQPFGEKEFVSHAKLQKIIKAPICLDESVTSLKTAKKAIELKSCKIINIKPARVCGYMNSIKIHNLCKKHNIPCWVGGRLETGIGQIFNLALASLSNFSLPSEIIPSNEFLKEDIISVKIHFKSGMAKIPKLKKGRIFLNEYILNKYLISREIFKG
jgi:o-succinylbenzoate synthase